MRSYVIAPLILLAVATPAFASDGVLEINQTCAVQTGCFAGDTAGFPVTITAASSYRLTGNLVNANANVNTIEIRSSLTTLDLNGFSITGTLTGCAWTVTSGVICSGYGPGTAIEGSIGCPFGNSVRNGIVYGAPNAGVRLCAASSVENVQVIGAVGNGIEVSESGIVRNCTVVLAYLSGIWAPGGLVIDSTVRDSGNSANGPYSFGVNGGSEVVAVRSVVLQRIWNNQYFQNGRSLGTNLCNGVSC